MSTIAPKLVSTKVRQQRSVRHGTHLLGSGLSGRRWRLRLPVRILSVQPFPVRFAVQKLKKKTAAIVFHSDPVLNSNSGHVLYSDCGIDVNLGSALDIAFIRGKKRRVAVEIKRIADAASIRAPPAAAGATISGLFLRQGFQIDARASDRSSYLKIFIYVDRLEGRPPRRSPRTDFAQILSKTVALRECGHELKLEQLEYEREVAASAIAFCPVSESSGCSLSSPLSINPFPSIRYSIPSQEAGNALLASLGLRVSMGSGDYLLSNGSPARLPSEMRRRMSYIGINIGADVYYEMTASVSGDSRALNMK
ncbi:hypothetical protein EVAR_32991_1 [Eumeta japonica]|uniref:Uncharacterized protein n=1 Tax=Eumeta variegata TaxID=151549 RepID=A0A4C1VTX2_EUMVA|nr:hypothetical protein EVAR_32991_1 [Eumeta japonica]